MFKEIKQQLKKLKKFNMEHAKKKFKRPLYINILGDSG
jgi:hypothetical protein